MSMEHLLQEKKGSVQVTTGTCQMNTKEGLNGLPLAKSGTIWELKYMIATYYIAQ